MKKNRISIFATVIAGCLMTLAMAAPAMAQEGIFTVKETVTVPGAVLTPGTYTFKLLRNPGLVEVSEISGRKVALCLTSPQSHEGNTDVSELMLKQNRVESVHFADSDLDLQFLYPSVKETAKNKVQAHVTGL
jgi:hypothetical protein